MKFKHAESEGWFYFIDDNGNKSQSFTAKNRPGLYQEMQEWVAEGNEIEPQFTAEELAEKEAQEQANALKSQKKICKKYLNETEYLISDDTPHPQDIGENKALRKQWRQIMKSDELQEIPKKIADR